MTAWMLLAYFTLFFVAAFVWPSVRLWQRARINALVLPRDDSAHGLIGAWLKVILAAIFAMLLALIAGVPAEPFGQFAWLDQAAGDFLGWTLLIASGLWIVVAQSQMGSSWRIGIDTGSAPPLVRSGLFGRSRNPIFLGMRANLLGLFLILPNAVTLSVLLLGEALIQIQVRLEEIHLSGLFGNEYISYRQTIPRWL